MSRRVSTAQRPPLGGGLDEAGRALFTDLYQLTMLQAYAEHGLTARATFELFARSLPANRSYLLACGLEDALGYLEGLRFGDEALAALERGGHFPSRASSTGSASCASRATCTRCPRAPPPSPASRC